MELVCHLWWWRYYLRCPADSHQNNGLEVYTTFFCVLEEFRELEALPVYVDYKGDHIPLYKI